MLSNSVCSDCCCWQTFIQQEQNLIVINSPTQYLKEELLGSYNYYPKPLWSNVVFEISELWRRIVGFFHSLLKIPYKRETFEGENIVQICEKYDFCGEKFCGLLVFAAPKNVTSPNFAKKTFTNSHKTMKLFCESLLPQKFPAIR